MKRALTILLVDDEKGFRENVGERLKSRGYQILEAGEAAGALTVAGERFVDVALVDLRMPGMDGIMLMAKLKEIDPLLEVVVVTGQGSIESAVDAMRKGAYHFVTKPVKLKELEIVVQRAVEKSRLARQNRIFSEELRRRRPARAPKIVHASMAMKKIMEDAARIAQTDATVLIEGETGTGKEVVAEFIHSQSNRHDRAFSVLNCGAMTENLIDTELFGYEKGAFTGATDSRPGLIEVTDGGTLLLDEIGDMSPAAQVRLLRFLERGVFRRVGSTREREVDVRVIAATHRDLERQAPEGNFREDLFHRLNVFRLKIPPLRDRPEDILPLAEYFLSRLTARGDSKKILSPEARAPLRSYGWPGNVRELSHAVERAWFAAGRDISSDDIRSEDLSLPSSSSVQSNIIPLREAEERHVRRILDHVVGNRKKAAEILGITERHLYRLIQKFGDR